MEIQAVAKIQYPIKSLYTYANRGPSGFQGDFLGRGGKFGDFLPQPSNIFFNMCGEGGDVLLWGSKFGV